MATQDISQLVVQVKSEGIKTAANQLDNLAKASDKAEKAVKNLGTAVVGVNGTLTGGVANASALVAAMTTLTAVLNRMATQTDRVRSATRANNEAMAEAHALARGLSGSLGALWVTYGNLAGMGVGIALGASLKGIVSIGKDVGQTLEEIRVLGGATTEDMKLMSQAVLDIGKGAQGPRDVAEALQVLTLAGLSAKEAMQGVQAALNLSIGGGVSVEKSAETLVQVGTALGYTANEYDHVSDVIVKAAAASMTSVESISGAFKSAAAVGEVYGASLKDIALGLSAIANLGIGGTAAGTALKNFYKDLSASTDKVTNTLKAMKLSIADFRDAQGFMLPLVDVVKKLNSGLNTLDSRNRNLAMVKLFSQQGVREGAILLKMLNDTVTTIDEQGKKVTTNKLEKLQADIEKSAAFAASAAIAMAQTTQNQLKSVGNTLQSTFAEVFTSIEPQIGEVARSLKAAFASEEFKSGLRSLATAVADLTKFIVDHINAIKILVEVYAAWKVIEFATGLVKIAQGFELASIAARGFTATLGPIGVAITALTAAWLIYKNTQNDALNNNAAATNLSEYISNAQKELDKQKMISDLRKKNMSEEEIARATQMQADADASDRAVKESEKGLNAMKAQLKVMYEKLNLNEKLAADGKFAAGIWQTSDVEKYKAQVTAVANAEASHANQVKVLAGTMKALREVTKENGDAADARAKAQRTISQGEGQLPGKSDKAAENAAYAAALQEQENQIKLNLQLLKDYKKETAEKLAAGTIGDMKAVQSVSAAESVAYRNILSAISEKEKIAGAGGDKRAADLTRFQGDYERYSEMLVSTAEQRDLKMAASQKAMDEAALRAKVQSLEMEGQYIAAAQLKWSAENKTAYDNAKKNLEEYGAVFPKLADIVKDFEDRQKSAINAATLKEAVRGFDIAALKVANTMKGFKASVAGFSIGEMMESAAEASEKYNVELKAAKDAYSKLEDAAKSGNADAVKAAEEANNKLLSLADKHRQMWLETGDTIARSLENAFGRGGKALGDMYKITKQYELNQNKSQEANLKYYGDMAGAAAGFFDKQSKGYKLLNGISQAFHVAEMARTAVSTAAKVAEAAATFFAQSGWGGFAGIAAMATVMAGLGFAMGGGGSKSDPTLSSEYVQKHQGTGTVFGDAEAKSESISKSIDKLGSNSDMMLPLTQGMLSSLKNIEAAMTGVANLAIRNGAVNGSNFNLGEGTKLSSIAKLMSWPLSSGIVGGLAGKIFGTSSTTLKDSGLSFGGSVSGLMNGQGINEYAVTETTKKALFGLISSTKDNTQTQAVSSELANQFGLIFKGLSSALQTAATGLGKDSGAVANAIENMVLQTTKVSLKDLKGDDLTNAINNVISGAMDQIAKQAFPGMEAFQHVGEGYAQTVIRVSSDVEVANSALKKLGVTAVKYTDITNKTGDVAYEIVKQSIAMKEGASGVGDIMKNIVGEVKDLTAAYAELVAARKQMEAMGLGSGLNMDTIAGAGSLKDLTSDLATYYDKYFTEAEKTKIQTDSMTEAFKALGYALPDSRDMLRAWIEAAAKAGDQTTVGSLLALAGAFDKLADSVETGLKKALKEVDTAFSNLKDSIAYQKKMVDRTYKADKDAASDHHKAILKQIDADTDAQIAAVKANEMARRMQLNGALSSLNAQRDDIESREKAYKDMVSGLEKIVNTLDQAIEATKPAAESYSRALGRVNDALDFAKKGGDISSISGLDDAIKTVAANSADSYSSAFEFNKAQAEANVALKSLRDSGQNAMTDAQKQIDLLEQQKEAIDTQTSAIKEALSNLGDGQIAAIKDAAQKRKDEEDARFQAENDALDTRHQNIIDALDEQLRLAGDQVDALHGINTTLQSLSSAIASFNSAVSGAVAAGGSTGGAPSPGGIGGSGNIGPNGTSGGGIGLDLGTPGPGLGSMYVNPIGSGTGGSASNPFFWENTVWDFMRNGAYVDGSHKDGLDEVPFDNYIARLHKGERVMPASDNAELMRRLDTDEKADSAKTSNEEVKVAIGELIETIKIGDTANVLKTNDMYRIFRDWETNGIPPTRTTT